MTGFFFALALAIQTATAGGYVKWDYDDVDLTVGPVEFFLVCLDGQATSTCSQIPATTGVVSTPGTKTYSWKLPPLLAGQHVVAVQACTVGGNDCSGGAVLRFTFQAMADPKNLRLGSAR